MKKATKQKKAVAPAQQQKPGAPKPLQHVEKLRAAFVEQRFYLLYGKSGASASMPAAQIDAIKKDLSAKLNVVVEYLDWLASVGYADGEMHEASERSCLARRETMWEPFRADWPLLWSAECCKKLRALDEAQQLSALERMFSHASGVIQPGKNCNKLLGEAVRYTCFYETPITKELSVVWMTAPQKLQTTGREPGTRYRMIMQVVDLLAPKQVKARVEKLVTQLTHAAPEQAADSAIAQREWEEVVALPPASSSKDPGLLLPMTFHRRAENASHNARGARAKTTKYNVNAAIHTTEVAKEVATDAVAVRHLLANERIIEELSSPESCQRLVAMLQNLPELQWKLSKQEEAVVGLPKNVLLIGRSGTGKTSCAILRLWARNKMFTLEYGHRYLHKTNSDRPSAAMTQSTATITAAAALPRSSATVSQQNKSSSEASSDPSNGAHEEGGDRFHSIFVTLSPVLCNQVRKFYDALERSQGVQQTVAEHMKAMGKQNSSAEDAAATRSNNGGAQGATPEGDDDGDEILDEEHDEEEASTELLDRATPNSFLKEDIEAHSGQEQVFPMFLTGRKFLYMLDGTLQQPFFARDKDRKVIQFNSTHCWHAEGAAGTTQIVRRFYESQAAVQKKIARQTALDAKALAKDDSDDEDDDDDEDNDDDDDDDDGDDNNGGDDDSGQVAKQAPSDALVTSFEIDYKYFALHLWNKIGGLGSRFHPSVLWTEIISFIKGHALGNSSGYLSFEEYNKLGKKVSPLLAESRAQIYEIFQAYEKHKQALRAYDLQDVVHHIHSRLKHEGYHGVAIHSIAVDEVQDFTQSNLQLLMSVCKQPDGFFFTGDTCQTIARGIGFRFEDLRSLFYFRRQNFALYERDYFVPSIHQLLVNFRTHSHALNLAHSVVELLEELFPMTIDKLQKDRGVRTGPMPVLMPSNSTDDLFAFLTRGSGDDGQLARMQFGARQAIIVREQECKDKLPPLLRHALCLTVYECKGLEFDDIILYNFFQDSPASVLDWRVICGFFSRASQQEEGDSSAALAELAPAASDAANKESHEPALQAVSFDLGQHGILCSELKQLYTAITRARRNILIFDEAVEKRAPMFALWTKRGLVVEPSEADGAQFVAATAAANPEEAKQQWARQGSSMMRHRFYMQAVKCFENAGDLARAARATAFLKAQTAGETQASLAAQPKSRHADLSQQAKSLFAEAGLLFEAHGLLRRAAQCYFSCGNYGKAAELFMALRLFADAAECYKALQRTEVAADCYVQAGNPAAAIALLQKAALWPRLLAVLASTLGSSLFEADQAVSKALQAMANQVLRCRPVAEAAGRIDASVMERLALASHDAMMQQPEPAGQVDLRQRAAVLGSLDRWAALSAAPAAAASAQAPLPPDVKAVTAFYLRHKAPEFAFFVVLSQRLPDERLFLESLLLALAALVHFWHHQMAAKRAGQTKACAQIRAYCQFTAQRHGSAAAGRVTSLLHSYGLWQLAAQLFEASLGPGAWLASDLEVDPKAASAWLQGERLVDRPLERRALARSICSRLLAKRYLVTPAQTSLSKRTASGGSTTHSAPANSQVDLAMLPKTSQDCAAPATDTLQSSGFWEINSLPPDVEQCLAVAGTAALDDVLLLVRLHELNLSNRATASQEALEELFTFQKTHGTPHLWHMLHLGMGLYLTKARLAKEQLALGVRFTAQLVSDFAQEIAAVFEGRTAQLDDFFDLRPYFLGDLSTPTGTFVLLPAATDAYLKALGFNPTKGPTPVLYYPLDAECNFFAVKRTPFYRQLCSFFMELLFSHVSSLVDLVGQGEHGLLQGALAKLHFKATRLLAAQYTFGTSTAPSESKRQQKKQRTTKSSTTTTADPALALSGRLLALLQPVSKPTGLLRAFGGSTKLCLVPSNSPLIEANQAAAGACSRALCEARFERALDTVRQLKKRSHQPSRLSVGQAVSLVNQFGACGRLLELGEAFRFAPQLGLSRAHLKLLDIEFYMRLRDWGASARSLLSYIDALHHDQRESTWVLLGLLVQQVVVLLCTLGSSDGGGSGRSQHMALIPTVFKTAFIAPLLRAGSANAIESYEISHNEASDMLDLLFDLLDELVRLVGSIDDSSDDGETFRAALMAILMIEFNQPEVRLTERQKSQLAESVHCSELLDLALDDLLDRGAFEEILEHRSGSDMLGSCALTPICMHSLGPLDAESHAQRLSAEWEREVLLRGSRLAAGIVICRAVQQNVKKPKGPARVSASSQEQQQQLLDRAETAFVNAGYQARGIELLSIDEIVWLAGAKQALEATVRGLAASTTPEADALPLIQSVERTLANIRDVRRWTAAPTKEPAAKSRAAWKLQKARKRKARKHQQRIQERKEYFKYLQRHGLRR